MLSLLILSLVATLDSSWAQTTVPPSSPARNVPPGTIDSISPAQATCPSQTFNCITHRLPQLCYTSTWAPLSELSVKGSGSVPTVSPNTDSVLSTIRDLDASQREATGTISSPPTSSASSTSSSSSHVLSDEPTSSEEQSIVTSTISSASRTAESSARVEKVPDGPSDSESPLDDAEFLSFEDWRRQNLAKAGQSAEHLGQKSQAGNEHRRRPEGLSNALESLGEDAEIDFDFAGFATPQVMLDNVHATHAGSRPVSSNIADNENGDTSTPRKRPKDAGRTCKERTNYASYDCAATTLKTNPECQSSSAILVENKDTYMLNKCSAQNKFFIVELCDNILIDTVVLANFEFFSSMFRTFRISVADRYPVKHENWKILGTYEARNSRDIQAFLVENPLIWARYLRVELLSHYGNEYYCPISLFRVHGTTMIEEFNNELKGPQNEDDVDGEDSLPVSEQDIADHQGNQAKVTPPYTESEKVALSDAMTEKQFVTAEQEPRITSDRQGQVSSNQAIPPVTELCPCEAASSQIQFKLEIPISSTCAAIWTSIAQVSEVKPTAIPITEPIHAQATLTMEAPNQTPSANRTSNESPQTTITEHSSGISRNVVTSTMTIKSAPITSNEATAKANTTAGMTASTISAAAAPSETDQISISSAYSFNKTSEVNGTLSTRGSSYSSSSKASSTTHAPASSPTTQESFFKSVHKRLQGLEANSTLSLQYIEEQSRILREAFAKVEKRQLAKTTSFLENLNGTVLHDLMEFRSQYDQIWQSTILELSSQRQQSQHEVLALSGRLSILADEVVFQKRLTILQFTLIILCLGIVFFSKHGSSPAVYLPPLVSNAITKSSTNLTRYAQSFESPPLTPAPSTNPTRYKFWRPFAHQQSPSMEAYDLAHPSPGIEYSPPTPVSQRSTSEAPFDSPKLEDQDDMPQSPIENDPPSPDRKSRPSSLPGSRTRSGSESAVRFFSTTMTPAVLSDHSSSDIDPQDEVFGDCQP